MEKEEFEALQKQLESPTEEFEGLTEAEVSDLFLDEYKKLCIRFGRDFIVDPTPKVAVVNFRIQK